MPPELQPAAVGAAAAVLGVSLDPQQLDRLVAFTRVLSRWNATHNLTALRGDDDILTHHLLDSLALVPHLAGLCGEGGRVLDVGSGGGLPGLVLAVALPRLDFTLIDAVRKKCAFLTQARLELALANVEVVHGRVEAFEAPPFDVIVARALARLAQFVGWTRHLLGPRGCWVAMKGRRPDDELAELPADLLAQVVPLQVPGLDEQRHLIEIRRA